MQSSNCGLQEHFIRFASVLKSDSRKLFNSSFLCQNRKLTNIYIQILNVQQYDVHTKLQNFYYKVFIKHISQDFGISDISKCETFIDITRSLTNFLFRYSTTSFVDQLTKFPSEPLKFKSLQHHESFKLTRTSLKYP